jgi:hypothetical protein
MKRKVKILEMRRKPLSNIRIIRIKKKNRILELIWDII